MTNGLVLLGSDGHLQLDADICLHGKKKSPCRRITGFEVCIAILIVLISFSLVLHWYVDYIRGIYCVTHSASFSAVLTTRF